MIQSDISRKYAVTRQSISKSVKLQERDVMVRLLDHARISGILVELYDEYHGFLVGIVPQLDNISCLMIIDSNNKPKLFFDQDGNNDKMKRAGTMKEIRTVIEGAVGLRIDVKRSFRQILDQLIEKRGS